MEGKYQGDLSGSGGRGGEGELSVIFLAVKVSFRIANRNGCHTVLVVKTD